DAQRHRQFVVAFAKSLHAMLEDRLTLERRHLAAGFLRRHRSRNTGVDRLRVRERDARGNLARVLVGDFQIGIRRDRLVGEVVGVGWFEHDAPRCMAIRRFYYYALVRFDVCTKIGTMIFMPPILDVRFYASGTGTEPVRDWLRELPREARKVLGDDIKTVQLGWPLGMPLVRKMEPGLWEVRSRVPAGIARLLFTVDGTTMILLHGFIKKSQKTPADDLDTARRRKHEV